MNEHLRGHLCHSSEEVECTLRSLTKKHCVELFRDVFEKLVRHWWKSVRSMVVSRGAVKTDDKRARIKNCFRVSFIELSILKQK